MWKRWPYDKAIDKLDELSTSSNTISMIRHSDRYPIREPEKSHLAMLTDEGKENAISFGKELSVINNIDFYHSPVDRCRQTIDYIRRGYKGSSDIKGVTNFSGCPYILDNKKFNEIIFKLGGRDFIENWILGDIPSSIIKPPKEAVKYMISGLKDKHYGKKGVIDIHVTHDINIALFLTAIKNFTKIEYEWPGYLEMIIISYKEDEICLHGRGFSQEITLGD